MARPKFLPRDDPIASSIQQRGRSRQHFAGGSARKGEEHDLVRLHAGLDEIRDAVDQRTGLPGTGATSDQ